MVTVNNRQLSILEKRCAMGLLCLLPLTLTILINSQSTSNLTSCSTQTCTRPLTGPRNAKNATAISYGDDKTNVFISYDDGNDFINIAYGDSWQKEVRLCLAVNSSTILKYEITDIQVGSEPNYAGFLGIVYYEGIKYEITDPLSMGNWEVVSSSDDITNPLVFATDDAPSPWQRNDCSDDVNPSTLWVWNGQLANTMVFQFRFSALIPTPGMLNCMPQYPRTQ